MKFLHQPFKAIAAERIIVEFSKPTRVMLLHSSQLKKYKMGKTYRYRGGFEEKSPVEFEVPFDGEWHAVIEKGTYKNPLEVKASAKLIKPKHHTLNGNEQMETHQAVEDEYDDTYE